MSDAIAAPAAAPTTIGALRDRHLALMREWRETSEPAEKAALAANFREDVKRAGCEIGNPGERDEAQGILDYWISAVVSLPDQPYPVPATLDTYVGEAGARAGGDARKVFQSFGSEDERRVARALFEDLLNKGPNGVERCGARTRAVLQQRLRGRNVDTVLAAFEASGAIVRRPGQSPDQDLFEAADASLVKEWPELDEWLSDRDEYERQRDILLKRAQQWEMADHSSAYLARGEDLRGIDRYSDETETLDKFIAASKQRSRRFRSLATGAAVVLGAVFLFLTWQSSQTFAARTAEAEARVDAEEAQDQRATPEAISAASDAPPVPFNTLPRLRLPTLEGALWLGSDERPQVTAPVRPGAATPPSAAREGTAYRVLADINLRDAMPALDGPYVSRPRKAVVRAGSLVILTGKTQAYDRPTGRQYWGPVQVVPRVYVQYAGAEKATVERFRRRLSEAGFDVPAAEEIGSARGKREIRYFDEADRPTAARLLRLLNRGARGDRAGAPFGCRSFAGSRASNRFALEIWLDPATARPSGPTACE